MIKITALMITSSTGKSLKPPPSSELEGNIEHLSCTELHNCTTSIKRETTNCNDYTISTLFLANSLSRGAKALELAIRVQG